jgi:hypothetical protein
MTLYNKSPFLVRPKTVSTGLKKKTRRGGDGQRSYEVESADLEHIKKAGWRPT